MNTNTNLPLIINEDEYNLPWQMTRWEKVAFISLVKKYTLWASGDVAMEIGNAQGGSLQVLADHFQHVYALDNSNEVHDALKKIFVRVSFCTGDSSITLPSILGNIQDGGEYLRFILIDGSHTAEGVKADINNILRNYKPKRELAIVCHDSFNPECRKGILAADWIDCKHLHYIDVDYIPGYLFPDGSMWGGFTLAILRPGTITKTTHIEQSLKSLYRLMFKNSRYNTLMYKLKRLIKE